MTRGIEIKGVEVMLFGDDDTSVNDIEIVDDLTKLPDCENTGYDVTVDIGEVGETGESLFYVTILSGTCRYGAEGTRHTAKGHPKVIKLPYFSGPDAMAALEKIVAKCDQGTFERSLPLLRKHFTWESDR